jgi:hypothetical protein
MSNKIVCPRTLPGSISTVAIQQCINERTAAGDFVRKAGCAGCPHFEEKYQRRKIGYKT